MADVSYYRERANHLRRLAEMTWQGELEVSLRRLAEDYDETADDLESFLDRWLKPDVTDQQLEDLWTASSADFFLLGDSVRPFLTQVLQRLQERRGQNSAS